MRPAGMVPVRPPAAATALAVISIILLSGCARSADDPPESQPPVALPDPSSTPDPEPGPLWTCAETCSVQTAAELALEPSGAVNPANPDQVAVAAIEVAATGYAAPGVQGPGWAYITVRWSHDGGQTLSRTPIPYQGTAPQGSAWNRFCVTADPVLLYAPNGTALLFGLGWPCSNSGGLAPGVSPAATSVGTIWLSRSTDGARSWSEPVEVYSSPGSVEWPDKEWAAIDPVTGRMVVAWQGLSRADPGQILRYSTSEDGGSTWSAAGVITDSAAEGGPPIFMPTPAFDASGGLHVGFRACGSEATCFKVASLPAEAEQWTISEVAPVSTLARDGPQFTNFWTPALAYDPVLDLLFVAWHADGGQMDVDAFVSWATPGSSNWSVPLRLHTNPPGDGTDQFMPWIVGSGSGGVHAFYYDRREDPDNNTIVRATAAWFVPGSILVEAAAGPSWVPNPGGSSQRVHYGEYQALGSAQGQALVTWTQVAAESGLRVNHASVFRVA